jgi:hypothetical protein
MRRNDTRGAPDSLRRRVSRHSVAGAGFIAAGSRFTDNSRLFLPARTVSNDPSKDHKAAGGLQNTLYKKETRSKRRMTPMRRFAWRIVAGFGVFLIKLFWRTCRVVRVVGDEHTEQGVSPSITPDGPKGPRFVFKPGAILLSQMSQRPMLPLAYAASRAWLIAWDKFVIPWPFSKIVIAVGEPRQVPRILQPAALEALQKDMAAELKKLFGVARDALHAKAGT